MSTLQLLQLPVKNNRGKLFISREKLNVAVRFLIQHFLDQRNNWRNPATSCKEYIPFALVYFGLYCKMPFRPHNINRLSYLKMLMRKLTKSTIFRSEEHTSELQSRGHLVCRLLLEKK